VSFSDALIAALDALRANLLRSVLTALGVIIGVASLIAMLGVGNGATARIDALIAGLGSNILTVTGGSSQGGGFRGGAGSLSTLTEGDARAIATEVDGVESVSGMVNGQGQLVYADANWASNISAIGEAYLEQNAWVLERGRLLDAADVRGARKVAVIGQTVARELFGGDDPIGKVIRINRVPVEIVGTLASKGQSTFGRDQDDAVFVPLSTGKRRLLGAGAINADAVQAIVVKGSEARPLDAIEADIRTLIRERHKIPPGGTDDFDVRNFAQFLTARTDTLRVMSTLLAIVAGISLIVGGIGIMNIMLVSVTERTREIGLRLALGATPRAVLKQFVLEALLISLGGGAIGIALGLTVATIVAKAGDMQMVIGAGTVLLAAGFAAATGLFFGYYPARRAAALKPIEALRRD
jgi:putative ABC transport system permease protein